MCLMTCNPTKCEFIHASHKNHPRIWIRILLAIYTEGHPIKVATHIKYMYGTIDEPSINLSTNMLTELPAKQTL